MPSLGMRSTSSLLDFGTTTARILQAALQVIEGSALMDNGRIQTAAATAVALAPSRAAEPCTCKAALHCQEGMLLPVCAAGFPRQGTPASPVTGRQRQSLRLPCASCALACDNCSSLQLATYIPYNAALAQISPA